MEAEKGECLLRELLESLLGFVAVYGIGYFVASRFPALRLWQRIDIRTGRNGFR